MFTHFAPQLLPHAIRPSLPDDPPTPLPFHPFTSSYIFLSDMPEMQRCWADFHGELQGMTWACFGLLCSRHGWCRVTHTWEALNMNLLKEFIKRCLFWCMFFWACCDKIASSYIPWNEQNVTNITLIHKENYVHPFLCDRWMYMGSAPCKYKSRNQAFNTLHFDVSNLTVDVHHIGSLH